MTPFGKRPMPESPRSLEAPVEPDVPAEQPQTGGMSLSPEEVGYREDVPCGRCAHMGTEGNCDRYGFPVADTGSCAAGFEERQGGTSDMDEAPMETEEVPV